MRIGVLCIATGNYKSLVQQLIDGVEKYFLINHEREIYLFTDDEREYKSGLKIIQTIIPSYRFPEATMLRYHVFTSREYDCDYLFYSDVDMGFVSEIGEDILSDIVAVRHPGFYKRECNSWEQNKRSACYIEPQDRGFYHAGGFLGGKANVFYEIMTYMKTIIDSDLKNGITPIWHDETAWNKALTCFGIKDSESLKSLTPEYCMPEAMTKRIAWGLRGFQPKILALEKNTKLMRS